MLNNHWKKSRKQLKMSKSNVYKIESKKVKKIKRSIIEIVKPSGKCMNSLERRNSLAKATKNYEAEAST